MTNSEYCNFRVNVIIRLIRMDGDQIQVIVDNNGDLPQMQLKHNIDPAEAACEILSGIMGYDEAKSMVLCQSSKPEVELEGADQLNITKTFFFNGPPRSGAWVNYNKKSLELFREFNHRSSQ